MNKRFLRHLQLILATLDLLSINVVFLTAAFLVNHPEITSNISIDLIKSKIPEPKDIDQSFGFVLTIAWSAVILLGGLYHEKYVLSFELFTKRSLQSYVYFLVPVIFYIYFFDQFETARYFIATVLFCIFISLLFNRFLYLAIYHYFKKKDYIFNKVIVIGYNDHSKKLVTYLEEEGINKEVIGYCEEYENITELSNYPILSNVSEAVDVCEKYGVNEIYSTIAPEHNQNIYHLITDADKKCIRFRIVPDIDLIVKSVKRVHIDYLKEMPVISLRNEPLEDLGNRIRKRLFDIAVSSLVTVFILSWLIPIIGLLIWLESRGPIFFVQERSGKDDKKFYCLKFRSMRVNDKAHEAQATKNDYRVTRIGKILRRSSLDEFPQFLNVLKGDMSIVGPRPHMVKHTEDYRRKIEEYMIRHFLKPGITGWAQIKGCRGETSKPGEMEKRVECDIWYLENWSLMLDLKIIFITAFNTIKGEVNAF